jgi:RNA polymerase subunit RPABC4/transcription elongation factor Spt4
MTPVPQRNRVIPFTCWVIASIVFLLAFLLLSLLFAREHNVPVAILIIFPLIVPLYLAAWTLLVGYVYGDARRRGMRHVMWTLLAIFVPNGIGIILYFILRDPLPSYCSKCGAVMPHGYAFCPRCGANMLPACPQCHRVSQVGWTHCASCGAKLIS